jgi:hypothetical protein
MANIIGSKTKALVAAMVREAESKFRRQPVGTDRRG